MVSLLTGLVLFTLLIWMPGVFLAGRLLEKTDRLERLGFGLGLGIVFVGLLTFTLSVATFSRYNLGYLALFAVPLDLLLLRELVRRVRTDGWHRALPRPTRHEALVLGLAGAIAVAFAVRYAREFFSYSCINRDTARLLGVTIGIFDWAFSLFEPTETLPANTALIAPFPALLGFLGFRLAFAAYTGAIALLAYLTAARLTGRRWVGYVVMLFLVTTPAYLVHYVLDPNILTLFTTLLFCALVLRGGVAPAGLALAGSLMFGSQHILLPALAAPLVRPEIDRRFALRYVLWLAAACLPWLAHHLLAFGSPFVTESFVEYDLQPHVFFGLEFEHRGLLNWPFTDRLVRTPFTPLPAGLQMGMYHLSRMGHLAASFVIGGGVVLLVTRRRDFLILAVFAAPAALLLSIQENWMQVEKWGIPLILYPAVVAAVAAGHAAAATPIRRRLLLTSWVGALAGTLLFSTLAAGISVPADARLYAQFPNLPREQEAYLRFEEDRIGRVGLAPDYRDIAAEVHHRRAWVEPFWQDLGRPGFARERTDRERSLGFMLDRLYALGVEQAQPPLEDGDGGAAFQASAGETVLVELSLAAPLIQGDQLRTVAEADGAIIDLTAGGAPAPIYNITVPWTEQPQSLAVFGTGDGVPVLSLFFEPGLMGDVDSLVENFGIEDRGTAYDVPPRRVRGDRLVFRVDPGRDLILVDNLCMEPSRIYAWRVRFVDGEARLGPALHWRHN